MGGSLELLDSQPGLICELQIQVKDHVSKQGLIMFATSMLYPKDSVT